MSKTVKVVERPPILLFMVGFLVLLTIKYSWRFFSGNFMNGKERNDATWWRDASPMYAKRRRAWSWWKRKSRLKRATWRNCIFWPCFWIAVGFWKSPDIMILILFWLAPFVGWYGWYKLRHVFFVQSTYSTDGRTEYYWSLKPRYLRWLLRWQEFMAKSEKTKPIPPEYERAVREEMRLDPEIGRQPIIKLKLLLDPEDDDEGR